MALATKPIAARLFAVLLGCLACTLSPASTGSGKPVISIIIDDLGYSLGQAREVMDISPGITLSVLPFAPYSKKVSKLAQERHREYMLHIPMQSHQRRNLDPGTLTLDMSDEEFLVALNDNLAAFDGYVGINNHKGSKLTANAPRMRMLMKTLSNQGPLFFIDSKTSSATHIGQFAHEFGIPSASRNVFLDVDREPQAIRAQFKRLLRVAHERGYAIAIGHPYPETLAVLREILGSQERENFLLLPVQRQLALRGIAPGLPQLAQTSPTIN